MPDLSHIDLELLRVLASIREQADRTREEATDEVHAWQRGAVIPDRAHVVALGVGRYVVINGLTRQHYNRLHDLGLLESRSTDLGGGFIRVRFSVTPAGVAAALQAGAQAPV